MTVTYHVMYEQITRTAPQGRLHKVLVCRISSPLCIYWVLDFSSFSKKYYSLLVRRYREIIAMYVDSWYSVFITK